MNPHWSIWAIAGVLGATVAAIEAFVQHNPISYGLCAVTSSIAFYMAGRTHAR